MSGASKVLRAGCPLFALIGGFLPLSWVVIWLLLGN